MRAVRCTGREVRVVELPEPSGPGVRVRVATAGVCGSDLHMLWQVQGVTLGPDDAPLSGVKVELQRELAPWPDQHTEVLESALTGDDGRFSFRTAAKPDLLVVAVKAGLALAEVEVLVI